MEALRQGRLPRDFAQGILRAAREYGIEASTVPRTEWLLRRAVVGSGLLSLNPGQIFNRDDLRDMNPCQLRELIARFSLALGDALHPDRQAEIIEKRLRDARFISEGRVAYLALEETIAPDRVFDEGSAPVFAMLEGARNRIVETLKRMQMFQMEREIRAGTLAQDDSRRVLGLQVADVAAGVARDAYESSSGDTRSRARAVRRIFSRVLVNDEWLT
jgi:hypothetical protein